MCWDILTTAFHRTECTSNRFCTCLISRDHVVVLLLTSAWQQTSLTLNAYSLATMEKVDNQSCIKLCCTVCFPWTCGILLPYRMLIPCCLLMWHWRDPSIFGDVEMFMRPLQVVGAWIWPWLWSWFWMWFWSWFWLQSIHCGWCNDDSGEHLGLVLNMVWMVNGLCDQSLDQSNCSHVIEHVYRHIGISVKKQMNHHPKNSTMHRQC